MKIVLTLLCVLALATPAVAQNPVHDAEDWCNQRDPCTWTIHAAATAGAAAAAEIVFDRADLGSLFAVGFYLGKEYEEHWRRGVPWTFDSTMDVLTPAFTAFILNKWVFD